MYIKENNNYYEKKIRFHIKYNKNLTLKEFANIMLLINKSINDINRHYGVRNRFISDYATEILSFHQGSIIIDTLVKVTNLINNVKIVKNREKENGNEKGKFEFVVKHILLPLLVSIIANNINNVNNKSTYNHQEIIKAYYNVYANNIIIDEKLEKHDKHIFIELINENTIEIRIEK